MFIIEKSKNPHNRDVFAVIEKFEKPNQYGDIEMVRAVFHTKEKANKYINQKLNK